MMARMQTKMKQTVAQAKLEEDEKKNCWRKLR